MFFVLVLCLVKLIIKVGGDFSSDLREIAKDPFKGEPGSHTAYVKDWKGVLTVLSPKRLELMAEMIAESSKENTVNGLADSLHRKQEAISRDAVVLQKHGLIQKVRNKKQVFLKPKFDSIEIRFAKGKN